MLEKLLEYFGFGFAVELIKRLSLHSELLKWFAAIIIIGGIILSIGRALYKLVNLFVLFRNQRILNKYLRPHYSHSDVIRATKYFIQSKFQNVSPSEDDEPSSQYIASAKQRLLPLFLKKVFTVNAKDDKYYLILADTGMGKTTFLINLYIAYKNKIRLVPGQHKYRIVLLPLGVPAILERVHLLTNKASTILLLDAFDEDVLALDRHRERMIEILKATEEFRFVVISCRTQFFPNVDEEPYRTGYYSFGDTRKEYRFQKIYLSVFDDKDIKQYLKKRYPFLKKKRRKQAQMIVKKSPSLVVRPLLLSHIDDLLKDRTEYHFTYQVYQSLIDKWIIRECNKPGIIERYGSAAKYQSLLIDFSENLACDLYINRENRGGYFIDKGERMITKRFATGNSDMELLQINDIESEYLDMTDTEKRSKSLLNRSSNGRYKFSHKSIMEYFLAKRLLYDTALLRSFNFDGMDATQKFLNELRQQTPSDLKAIGYCYLVENGCSYPLALLIDFQHVIFIKFQKDEKLLYDLYIASINFSNVSNGNFITFHTHVLKNCLSAIIKDDEIDPYLLENSESKNEISDRLKESYRRLNITRNNVKKYKITNITDVYNILRIPSCDCMINFGLYPTLIKHLKRYKYIDITNARYNFKMLDNSNHYIMEYGVSAFLQVDILKIIVDIISFEDYLQLMLSQTILEKGEQYVNSSLSKYELFIKNAEGLSNLRSGQTYY